MSYIGPLTPDTLITQSLGDGINYNVKLHVSTEAEYESFRELFDLAPGNTAMKQALRGRRKFVDHTANHQNVQYCTWATGIKMKDGYYLLRGIGRPDLMYGQWIFSVQLTFLGTKAIMENGLYIKDISMITNDWSS